MKFEKKEITFNVFIQYIEQPYSSASIVRKNTGDVMQYAGRLQNTDKFVFKNIMKDVYSEYTMEEIFEKLYIEIPTLEISDWIAVWQPSGKFIYKLIKTKTDCDKYNSCRNWRQVTQAELEQLNKPIPIPLSIEEATDILQKRIEKAVAESVKEAFAEWQKKDEVKYTGVSTNNWCENEL